MNYKNITHNLETLTDKQQIDLNTADILISNINSIRPSHVTSNLLKYNGKDFSLVRGGYLNGFLLEDIEYTLNNDEEKHIDFILNYIQEAFRMFDIESKYRKISNINLKDNLFSIIEYYKLNTELNYPLYLKTDDFKNYINKLESKVKAEF